MCDPLSRLGLFGLRLPRPLQSRPAQTEPGQRIAPDAPPLSSVIQLDVLGLQVPYAKWWEAWRPDP